jgi:hypothetical protein
VASKAQGWMPMMGSAELVATARTVPITSLDQLAGMIAEIRDAAAQAGRTSAIDVLSSYQDWSIATPEAEPDRHREAFAGYEKAGVTHLVISCRTRTAAQTLEFIEAFGRAYLSPAPGPA